MSMSPGRLLRSRAQLLICERAREPRTCVPLGRRTQTPESFLWRSISSLLVPDVVAVEHAGGGCCQYRPLREVAVLKDPHIVFRGKAKLLRRCPAVARLPYRPVREGFVPSWSAKSLLYRPPWEGISSSPGNLGALPLSSCPGTYTVLTGKPCRPAWELMSSFVGRHIVSPGKVYRPARENVSSSPGNRVAVFAAKVRFSHNNRGKRPVFVCVNCLVCFYRKRAGLASG
jgi:hypothetical protein